MARSDRRHHVTCESCGSETTVDDEAKRLGGYCECPICGAEVNLDATVEDDTGGATA